MDTQKIVLDIRKQVGALHQLRHPSKGVVVEVPGFQEAVDRRNRLMRKLVDHQRKLPTLLRRKDLIERTKRRWGHIRNRLDEGDPTFTLHMEVRGDQVIGVSFDDFEQARTLFIAQDGLKAINSALYQFAKRAKAEKAYVVIHDFQNMTERFKEVGITLPKMETIDTAYTTMVITGQKQSAVEAGRMVGVHRDDYESFGNYLFAVARAYAAVPDIMTLG